MSSEVGIIRKKKSYFNYLSISLICTSTRAELFNPHNDYRELLIAQHSAMLSAKIQIDNLVKSNKIVIFVRIGRAEERNERVTTQRNQIMDSIRETIRNRTEISSLESDSSKNFFYKSISLNTESFIRNLLDSQHDDELKFDICQFLDTYAIARKFVNVVDVDYLRDGAECELYLRKVCKEQTLKYPLIFMHGVYFGSDEEILLGHSKGFLFELFRDTGLYNMSVIRNHFDYSETKTALTEENMSDLSSSQDSDDEMIERVAIDNQFELLIDSSSLGTTSTVRNFINSRSPRLAAPVMTNYQSDSFLTSESCSEKSNMENSIRARLKGIDFSAQKHLSESSNIADDSELSRMEKRAKKFTPPGDVLATINKWLKKTQQVIETRNKIIAFKNSIISIK
ncbi:hypothetical protein BpHYR1_010919 [Brachionus plicatilis]|uniref:Uncharacterized protein n=1 Tax=Brachionus plicatilis TaxID=10195 RepID=A0A3M7SCE1_BRAPC|nr:hypothetical protein BpHYR1_010919 [Brachionus plicatilis]